MRNFSDSVFRENKKINILFENISFYEINGKI